MRYEHMRQVPSPLMGNEDAPKAKNSPQPPRFESIAKTGGRFRKWEWGRGGDSARTAEPKNCPHSSQPQPQARMGPFARLGYRNVRLE